MNVIFRLPESGSRSTERDFSHGQTDRHTDGHAHRNTLQFASRPIGDEVVISSSTQYLSASNFSELF